MGKPKRRLQGSVAPTLAVVAVVAAAYAGTTACATANAAPRYEAVCVDPKTQERVPDTMCNGAPDVYVAPTAGPVVFTSAFHCGWYYYDDDSDVVIPSYYGRVSGGGWSTPGATIVNNRTTINNTNITVNRGGITPSGGQASKVIVKTVSGGSGSSSGSSSKSGSSSSSTSGSSNKSTGSPGISRGGFGTGSSSSSSGSSARGSSSSGSGSAGS